MHVRLFACYVLVALVVGGCSLAYDIGKGNVTVTRDQL